MLRVPTVAVDAQRVVLIVPVGAVLAVTSDASSEPRMVEVMWQDRKLAMFGGDLMERGEENFEIEEVDQEPDVVDPHEIRRLLQDDFNAAQQLRAQASKWFTEVVNDIPSGIPQPDGTNRIKLASREYAASREAASAAMKRLNDFKIRGIIPPGLERKPAAKETAEPEKNRKPGDR
ncbi:MAG TPA: hypothetical protein VGJ09_00105 [Bryobacteraceae bacterium]|jgi:hypothetical protein